MKIHPNVTIGHVHLTVSNLKCSLEFYQGILGFEITARYGDHAVFLSAGGYHHHIGLNVWSGEGISPQDNRTAGLYHFAILYPSRKELAETIKSILDANYPIEGTSDHGVSEAIYLRDPDNIGVELYTDRPKDEWPVSDSGELYMVTKSLDIESLLAELQ